MNKILKFLLGFSIIPIFIVFGLYSSDASAIFWIVYGFAVIMLCTLLGFIAMENL